MVFCLCLAQCFAASAHHALLYNPLSPAPLLFSFVCFVKLKWGSGHLYTQLLYAMPSLCVQPLVS